MSLTIPLPAPVVDKLAAKTWKTADGTVLTWSAMTTSHLRNAANHIRQHASRIVSEAWRFECSLQGEMALLYAEQNTEAVEEDANHLRLKADWMDRYAAHREATP